MKSISRLFALLAALFASTAVSPLRAQTSVTLTWNFGTTAGSATPTGLVTGLSGGTVSQGNNNGTTNLLLTDSSSSTTYTGASGGFNAGVAARPGNLSLTSSAYFAFSFDVAAGQEFTITSLSFGSRGTGTGPLSYSLLSSTSGFSGTTTTHATGTLLANSTWALQQPTLSTSIVLSSGITELRLYGFGSAGSPNANTTNWRIDDVRINGTLAASAIPEPSTYAAIAGALSLGGAVWWRRRQRIGKSPGGAPGHA
jgi:hypothetical protein